MKYFAITISSFFLSFFSFSQIKSPVANKKAKNIIFFIGDGMGVSHITGARIWHKGSEGRLNLESFPITGLVKTHSSLDYVTDSAAAATSLATGVRTYNGAIAVTDPRRDPRKKSRKLQTLLDLAKAQNKMTGVITTVTVSHATPASFYSHAKNRSLENRIAAQIKDAPVDLLFGGGRSFFYPQGYKDPLTKKLSMRRDNLNVVEELKAKSWDYVDTRDKLRKLNILQTKKILGLFAYEELSCDLVRQKENNQHEPSLSEMLSFAIKFLKKSSNGFVLVVEAGQIDYASHRNDAENAFGELIALDRAIKVAKDMTSPEDTLILVTADHETGGLALNGYGSLKTIAGDNFLTGVDELSEQRITSISWSSGPSGLNAKTEKHPATFYRSSASHTAQDVPIMALGVGQEMFAGFMDNSDIAWKIAKAMGTKFTSEVNLENRKFIRVKKNISNKELKFSSK